MVDVRLPSWDVLLTLTHLVDRIPLDWADGVGFVFGDG